MATPRVFFGWWVVLAFAVMNFLSSGIRFSVGPFMKPMVADLELDRASFSLVISLSLFLFGAFMPFIGRLVDRFGARPVVASGVVVLSASLLSLGLVTRFWHLVVIYGVLVALGLAAAGNVIGSTVITRWFARRRATALTMLAGASMAGVTMLVPVAMWLVLTVGWRATYALFGVLVLVTMLPLTLWVIRESPESMGLEPDGAAPAATARPLGTERTDITTALRTLSFWQLAGGLFACGFSMTLISAHGVPMLTDHGYPPMFASWALGVLGGSSMLCALLLGAIADRWGRRPVLAWLYGSRVLTLAALFLIRDHPTALLVAAVLGGATLTGTVSMASALTADIFGRFSVGSILGTMFLVHQTGSALGTWLGGVVFEQTGGYGLSVALAATLLVAASLLSMTIRERPRALPRLAVVAGGE